MLRSWFVLDDYLKCPDANEQAEHVWRFRDIKTKPQGTHLPGISEYPKL